MKMDAKENDANLSVPLGEFADRELEKEFINFEINSALKYLRPAILILSFVFFLFVIPDYFLTQNKITFYAIFIARATFWVTGVLLILGIKRLENYTALSPVLLVSSVFSPFAWMRRFSSGEKLLSGKKLPRNGPNGHG